MNRKQMSQKSGLKNLSSLMAIAGISTLVSLPVLAQYYYPPSSFFQPTASNFQSEDPCFEALDVNQNIVYNLQVGCFDTLVANLEKAGLPKTLEQQKTFTILAPSNEAFQKLPEDIREQLSKPENLEKVLKYHLVAGVIGNNEIKRGEITTVEGNTVKITGFLIDPNTVGTKLNEATANYTIKANNGYIVAIDKVLLPPDFQTE